MGYLRPLDSVDGRRRYAVHSPVDDHLVGEYSVANAEDVRAAVARARAAQPAWAATPVAERAKVVLKAVDVLLARQDTFAEKMYAETGRARLETIMMELFASCDSMNFYARRAPKVLADQRVGLHLLRMKRATIAWQPLGVVGIITPWNGPFVLSLNPSVQALLAGNAVVVKPSEVTPFSAMLVEELFREAGLPADLLQVLTGDGETGAALLDAKVDKISFTGSVATGRKVGEACGRNLVPCTLELGGKDPMIVCADADLDRAAGGAVFGGMLNAGQYCSSIERVYVVESVAEVFTTKVVEKVKAMQLGRDMGPFIFDRQIGIVLSHLEDAVARGATIRAGGQRQGNSLEPTVLTGVTHAMKVMTEETFGPILPIMVARDEDHAVALANDSRYGLGACVWTKDTRRGEALARRITSGSVSVNEAPMTYGGLELPFGGRKESGVGQVNGADALRKWSWAQPILTDRFGFKEEQVWHPYTDDKVDGLRKALGYIWGTPLRWLM